MCFPESLKQKQKKEDSKASIRSLLIYPQQVAKKSSSRHPPRHRSDDVLAVTPPYEGFVVPEELDFVVGLKEESFHCEMMERAAGGSI